MPMNERRGRLRSASSRMWAANSYSLIPSAGSARGFFSRIDCGMTWAISASTDSTPMVESICFRSFSSVTPMWREENVSNMSFGLVYSLVADF